MFKMKTTKKAKAEPKEHTAKEAAATEKPEPPPIAPENQRLNALKPTPEPPATPGAASGNASGATTEPPPPTHFDEYLDEPEPTPEAKADAAGYLSKEEFHDLFCGTFELGSDFTGLESLNVRDSLPKRSTAASATLYKYALKYKWLRWMIEPSSEFMQDMAAFGLFGWGLHKAVRAEIAAKHAAMRQDGDKKSPAAGNFSAAKEAAAQPSADGNPSPDQAAALGAA